MNKKSLFVYFLVTIVILLLLNFSINRATGNKIEIKVLDTEVKSTYSYEINDYFLLVIVFEVQISNSGGFKLGSNPMCGPTLEFNMISTTYQADREFGFAGAICDGGGSTPYPFSPLYDEVIEYQGEFLLPPGNTSFSLEYMDIEDPNSSITFQISGSQPTVNIIY